MYRSNPFFSLALAFTLVFASVVIAYGQAEPTPTPMAEEEVTTDDEQSVEELLQEFTPSIDVRDQVFSVRDGVSVTVPELFATENGWIVIYTDDGSEPGVVVGYAFVEAGPRYGIVVNLTEELTGDTVLWAVLHLDAGEAGNYEFPGPDVVVELDGEPVMAQFVALEPGIVVSNQNVSGNSVTIDAVVAASDGWVAVRRSEEGAPGEVLGYAPVAPGVTPNISVELTGDLSYEETLWATLHYDAGVRGEFEFPGDDQEVSVPRGTVRIWFVVYPEGVAESETMAADASSTPTAEAEMAVPMATATPLAQAVGEPETLPATGGSLAQENNSALPWIVVLIAAFAVAGGTLFRRRMG